MGRKSLKETRQLEIIKIFYKVAKKEGLENTSIAKIAKVMDINPSLIIHYFQTKEELTYALIDYLLDKYLLIYKVGNDINVPPQIALTAVLEDLFSRKWNNLFDDGLFYSCYALAFRDKKVKVMYSNLTDKLRLSLAELIERCKVLNLVEVDDPQRAADLIFALIDGAYFYLSMSTDNKAFNKKITSYKTQAFHLLGLRSMT
ncbi:TetR family transcriptional regulator [Sphingobacterium sp. DR205]|uniref:TetR family transcriptional regulator n=1 Tax=Sphingobacterium sp. DR205 TaxID=2713573 RepID=UPI0013E51BB9|nr:TetR family transcriptional regulator [Sphingobacterium sp. DR205]QIH35614.1 TetR/AcrR family transcriptional regulator [Sphingobacterium sp. DR205]